VARPGVFRSTGIQRDNSGQCPALSGLSRCPHCSPSRPASPLSTGPLGTRHRQVRQRRPQPSMFGIPLQRKDFAPFSRPCAAPCCGNFTGVQLAGDAAETGGASLLDVPDEGGQIGRTCCCCGLLGLSGHTMVLSSRQDAPEAPHLHTAGLRGHQSLLGPGADHLALAFGGPPARPRLALVTEGGPQTV